MPEGNAGCVLGTAFSSGFVGVLTAVRYFMPTIYDRNLFVTNLVFQGSSDNITYTDLFTVDNDVHEGWNYYKWSTATRSTGGSSQASQPAAADVTHFTQMYQNTSNAWKNCPTEQVASFFNISGADDLYLGTTWTAADVDGNGALSETEYADFCGKIEAYFGAKGGCSPDRDAEDYAAEFVVLD